MAVLEPADFTKLSIEDLDRIMALKIKPGPVIRVDGGSLQGHILAVQNHQQIRDAFMNMKLNFPDANHVICAYLIPGIQTYYNRDSCDDGENMAGSKILEMMDYYQITSRVVFVVRYSNGTKLGQKRFEHILNTAKGAINAHPNNPYCEQKQGVQNIDFPKKKRAPRKPYGKPKTFGGNQQPKKVKKIYVPTTKISNPWASMNFRFSEPAQLMNGEWNENTDEVEGATAANWEAND